MFFHQPPLRLAMKKSLLSALMLAGFLDIANFFMPIPIYTPLFLHSNLLLGYPEESKSILLGILVACYGVAQLIAAPIFGELSDQRGRKKIILLSLSMAVIGCILGGLSLSITSLPLIFLSRILIGVASGTIAIVFAAAADNSSEKDRPKNLGYINTGLAVGVITGPIIGGHLVAVGSTSPHAFSYPFYFMALVYLANIFLLIKVLPFDLPSKKQGKRIHIFTAFQNITIAMKRSRYLCLMILMALFFQIGTESFYLAAPIVAVRQFVMTPPMIANYFIGFGIVGAITSWWLNKVVSHIWSTRAICAYSIILYFIGISSFIIVHNKISFFIPFFSVAIFGVLAWIHTNNLFSQAVDSTEQGLILGVSQSLWSMGGMLGTFLVGIIDAVHQVSVPYLPVLFIAISSIFAVLMLKSQQIKPSAI